MSPEPAREWGCWHILQFVDARLQNPGYKHVLNELLLKISHIFANISKEWTYLCFLLLLDLSVRMIFEHASWCNIMVHLYVLHTAASLLERLLYQPLQINSFPGLMPYHYHFVCFSLKQLGMLTKQWY